ncbi:MAG: cupin domain-containing protein [Leptospiraceae bacterium]|nr:cupin domain-containing protein [Leptospiraceae bacterium]MCB1302991.1 cupin domain-containing protein [Leptospiraceae bacterium]
MHPGVKVYKWPHREEPTEESVSRELASYGFQVYDLQTCDPWFERSSHSHDYEEIRGAVSGVITFYFDDDPVTIEGGDILVIPPGVPHVVRSHNGRPFTAYKGSRDGKRSVTEHGDGKGSMETLKASGQYQGSN